MTLRDYDAFAQGAVAREERDRELLAWQTAHMLNVWRAKGRPPTTVDRLLGRRRRGGRFRPGPGAQEAFEAEMARRERVRLGLEEAEG